MKKIIRFSNKHCKSTYGFDQWVLWLVILPIMVAIQMFFMMNWWQSVIFTALVLMFLWRRNWRKTQRILRFKLENHMCDSNDIVEVMMHFNFFNPKNEDILKMWREELQRLSTIEGSGVKQKEDGFEVRKKSI